MDILTVGIQYKESLKEYLTIRLSDGFDYRLYQDSMGVMAISGVAWDAGLYLVDLLVQLSISRRFHQVDNHQPIDDDHIVNNKILSIDNDIDHDNTKSYINSSIHDFSFGCTLDIGCGTGIGGVTALLLGAEYVLFTDMHKRSCLDDTLNQLQQQQQQLIDKTAFVSYEWNEIVIDERITSCHYTVGTADADDDDIDNEKKEHCTRSSSNRSISDRGDHPIKHWDTVICSDLLYEAANHMKLLNVLKGIKFKRAFISYKKRHHIPEVEFFRCLSQSFDIFLCDPKSITLNNLPPNALSGLYLLLIIPSMRGEVALLH